MRNIYIIGAQCTGKTTLVDAFEKRIALETDVDQPAVIREVARNVLTQGGFTREDIENSPERAKRLQKSILSAQYKIETSILETTGLEWYISDRSGLDPIVYANVFVDAGSAQELLATEEWSLLEANMKSGLVVLCEAGCEWLTDDGIRLMPKDDADWDRFDSAFRNVLAARGINYVVLPRTLRNIVDRVDFVVSLQKLSRGTG